MKEAIEVIYDMGGNQIAVGDTVICIARKKGTALWRTEPRTLTIASTCLPKHRYYLLLSCAFDALILVYLFWGKS